ncbi:acyl carrier protein [candidate division KSB1 bacterium 4572_119]|nr:MAG: acyl carrier protein [candidate division KSB1 bacterium 4572_119]
MKDKIKYFIVDNFLFGEDNGFNGETSFLEEGIVDSMGILELISFLEETFDIEINDDELIPQNLDSLNNITNFLRKKNARV